MTATTDTTGFGGKDKDLEGQPVKPDPNAPATPEPAEPAEPKPNGVEPKDNGYPYTELKEPKPNA